jgi:hypothetical protein
MMKGEDFLHRLAIGVPEISQEIFGGNSSVFMGHLPDGTELAIKKYKGNQQRIERMLSREERAVTFLRENALKNVPEILEVRGDLGLIVYRWIEGSAPLADHDSMGAIIDMCRALQEIHNRGLSFDNAIDAAFSLSEIDSQVSTRIQQFEETYSSVDVKILCERLRDLLSLCTNGKNLDTNFTLHTFSVSDLGTHNIIHSGNDYNFIDFEFFGLDSINKLVGDFLLHPRNEFSEFEISRFIEAISQRSPWDPSELIEVLPLLTLKWAVIAFGRTFRESVLAATGSITEREIAESKGSKYLEYFDMLRFADGKDSFRTFGSFKGKIAKP